MTKRSPFRYFKTSPEIIRLAVMLYIRFPLSLRNVEDLLHERGIEISHETVRYWWNRFGPMFAAEIRNRRVDRMRARRHWRWHLDEVYVKINGVTHYLWRAVDHEGEVLESVVTKTRDRKAALGFLKKAMKRHGRPEVIVTDRLRSYGAALKDLGRGDDREMGRWLNNRAENSHLPFRRRERAMLRFRRMRTLQKFASVHASVHNHFPTERHLQTRDHFKRHCQSNQAQLAFFVSPFMIKGKTPRSLGSTPRGTKQDTPTDRIRTISDKVLLTMPWELFGGSGLRSPVESEVLLTTPTGRICAAQSTYMAKDLSVRQDSRTAKGHEASEPRAIRVA